MVNQLPQGWKEEELGKHADIKRGTTITKKQVISGDYPVVAGGKEAAYYHNEYNRQPPVITVSGSGASAGYVNYWEVPIFASDCSTIEEKDLNIKYIYYFLKSRQQELLDKQVGVAIPHVSPKDIYPLLIPYPTDEDEQEYIVKTLDAVAEMIKLRKETIDLTKKLIPAIFQEMFGDPNIEDVNYVPFNQFFVVVNNEKKEIKSEDYRTKEDGLLPVVDQGKKEIVAYTEQFDKKISAHDNPVILFGDHTREVKFIDFDFVVGADGTQLMRTVEGVEPLFAFWQLKMKHIESKGYSRHFKYVKAMKFLIADNTKQKEFAKKVEQINKYIVAQQEELEHFETLFQSLLQEAFTGVLTWKYPREENND